jgi:hypothetical protein
MNRLDGQEGVRRSPMTSRYIRHLIVLRCLTGDPYDLVDAFLSLAGFWISYHDLGVAFCPSTTPSPGMTSGRLLILFSCPPLRSSSPPPPLPAPRTRPARVLCLRKSPPVSAQTAGINRSAAGPACCSGCGRRFTRAWLSDTGGAIEIVASGAKPQPYASSHTLSSLPA